MVLILLTTHLVSTPRSNLKETRLRAPLLLPLVTPHTPLHHHVDTPHQVAHTTEPPPIAPPLVHHQGEPDTSPLLLLPLDQHPQIMVEMSRVAMLLHPYQCQLLLPFTPQWTLPSKWTLLYQLLQRRIKKENLRGGFCVLIQFNTLDLVNLELGKLCLPLSPKLVLVLSHEERHPVITILDQRRRAWRRKSLRAMRTFTRSIKVVTVEMQ